MIKPEDLRKMTPAQRAALSRKEVGARAQGQINKPKPINPGPKSRLNSTKPTPKPKFKKAMPSPGSGNDPVTKTLKFFFGDKTKPSGKKDGPAKRTQRNGGRPARMPEYKPRETPGQILPLIGGRNSTPVPMPKINPGPRKRKPQPLARLKKKM